MIATRLVSVTGASRRFRQTCVSAAAGLVMFAAISGMPRSAIAQSDLAKSFQNPPAQAKPHTWWHWMNGNVSREGIDADLKAMKEIGLGGAQIFNVSESIPLGPAPFMTPQWRELFVHAVQEADRQGLELCVHNCAGWSSSGGPWITPEHAMQMVVCTESIAEGGKLFDRVLAQPETRHAYYRDIAVLAMPRPASDRRINDIRVKAGYEARYDQQPSLDVYPPDCVTKRESVIDLTDKLAADGRLKWDAPAAGAGANAEWVIVRIGFTPTGAVNAPSPDAGRGLECDKLSREAFDAHWAGMMAPVLKDLGPLAGKTLNNCLIDSYEVGGQNWTPKFKEEFSRRRGYDLTPFLPALTGMVVDSGEVSERFLWDFRRTIADLFADNYFTYFAEVCKKNGLLASIEPYDGPFECLLAGRDADIPMGEFWVGSGESTSCKLAASVAHIYGRKLVGAESFTAEPNTGRWQNHPGALKGVGDLMYTVGINRYIIHRYAHQPWADKVPGMTMGQWGTHFERTNTWWNDGGAWIQYLARCQAMLQQGLFVADVCYLAGESAPQHAPQNSALKAMGYDYDSVNADVVLNRMSVKNGRLTLPDGMSYQVMVLPESRFMTLALLTKIKDLVTQGATLIGPPPERSPSLSGYPECDKAVADLAADIWANAGRPGRALIGQPVEKVLADAGLKPDCSFTGASGKIAWIHRVIGDDDVYFLSNQKARAQEFDVACRVTGKAPELWRAETGSIEPAPVWYEKNGRTTLTLRLESLESVFVVFRKTTAPVNHIATVDFPLPQAAARLPKIQIRKAVYEATDGAGAADVTTKVAAMVKSGQTEIPANNSTFGDPAYMHVKRLRIEYAVDNAKAQTRTVDENATLELVDLGPDSSPQYTFARNGRGGIDVKVYKPGMYQFSSADGKIEQVTVESVPAPLAISGSWQVKFQQGRGAPDSIILDSLLSWPDHPNAGVKHFSGTAEYLKEFNVPAELLSEDAALTLDLGAVKCLARVTLNGTDLGVWWKAPFTMDVTPHLKAGKNTLSVSVTNLWINRLIGDEQLPDDCEWNGKPIKQWPDWMVKNQPRPSKDRVTFTTWKHYTKTSSLVESGLIGPVQLRPAKRMSVTISQ